MAKNNFTDQVCETSQTWSVPEVLVITGPTASGKSEVSLILAEKLGTEIVSADSMQVYRGLEIGTAKPSKEDLSRVRHHLIDIVDFGEQFDVYEYQKQARGALRKIIKEHGVAILTGGTGLYIRAAIEDLKFPPKEEHVRKELEAELEKHGEEKLFRQLREVDPAAAEEIDPKNTRRVIRALEVFRITGKPFSRILVDWADRTTIFSTKIFVISRPREELYDRINRRVDKMIQSGLVEETEGLVKKGFKERLTSWQAIGYKEIIDFLEGSKSLEQAAEEIKTRTRKYAKRQLTWFRSDPRIIWIDASRGETPIEMADKIIKELKE